MRGTKNEGKEVGEMDKARAEETELVLCACERDGMSCLRCTYLMNDTSDVLNEKLTCIASQRNKT